MRPSLGVLLWLDCLQKLLDNIVILECAFAGASTLLHRGHRALDNYGEMRPNVRSKVCTSIPHISFELMTEVKKGRGQVRLLQAAYPA